MIFLYIGLGLVAVIVILSSIIGKKMIIEEQIDISKKPSDVFDYLVLTKNQDNFSVWNMTDPGMDKKYQNEDGKVGFIYTWDSTNKNVGAGEQEITAIEAGKSITYEIRFKRPMQNVATGKFLVESLIDNRSRVTWGFYGESPFPMNLFQPIFKGMLRKDMSKSLQNLKELLEK